MSHKGKTFERIISYHTLTRTHAHILQKRLRKSISKFCER